MATEHPSLEQYRTNYPEAPQDTSKSDNLEFYLNKIPSQPDNMLIEDILSTKPKDYTFLETGHNYIQWLFPIQEQGLNKMVHPLQKHEAEAMRSNPDVRNRMIRSYAMMLDFYGMKLVNQETGEVRRSDSDWEDRLKNLNWSSHNYLRITRILKCLGEVGLEHMKAPWLRHMLEEIYIQKTMSCAAESIERFWIGTLRSNEERSEMYRLQQQMKADNPLPTPDPFAFPDGLVGGFSVEPLETCPHCALIGAPPTKEEFNSKYFSAICGGCGGVPKVGLNMMCTVCRDTQCGRSCEGHMQIHAVMEAHSIVFGLEDFSFWCYVCDTYVSCYNTNTFPWYSAAHHAKFGEIPKKPS